MTGHDEELRRRNLRTAENLFGIVVILYTGVILLQSLARML